MLAREKFKGPRVQHKPDLSGPSGESHATKQTRQTEQTK
jgi:hypothetical protein